MNQSPEISGGAGFSFEDATVAIYLAALLGEESALGLLGRIVVRVAVQQVAFGEPLDDLIVDGVGVDESRARLSLQVKRAVRISAAKTNTDFREIVSRAFATIRRPDFREDRDRVGAIVGTIADGPRRALIEVCEWARQSTDAETFLARFKVKGVAGPERRAVLKAFQKIMSETTNGVADSDAFRLLRHFVLIHLDLLHEGAADEATAIERLRLRLHDSDVHRAGDLWTRLLTIARAGAGRSAEFSRASLVRDLHGAFRLAGAPSLAATLERIDEEAKLSLATIPSDIAGIEIERSTLDDAITAALEKRRFVQLIGLPGTGKSAALRGFAESTANRRPALVLKSDRLTGPSWAAYAHSIGLAVAPIETLLTEIAATGSAILFIDGIDRVEVANRGILSDLIGTILTCSLLTNWKIVATSRDNGIEPLRTWLPAALLDEDGIASIEVKPFDDAEARELAAAEPALRPLLFGDARVRDIARRPFFASVLARALPNTIPETAPRSEIELIEAWWQRGGYDSQDSQASHRQRTLIALAKAGAMTFGRRMRLDGIDLDALAALKRDGIVRDVSAGHTVQFAHDILFEWSFLHRLIDCEDEWIDAIRSAGEPPVLGRSVELLSQSVFLTFGKWEETLHRLESAPVRPQWLRSWLIGPFGDPAFLDKADNFTEAILAEDGKRLRKLVIWFQAEKTRANPRVLDRSFGSSEFGRAEIIRMADALAWPSDVGSWDRFCRWVLGIINRCPIEAVPDILSVFGVWQNMLAEYPNGVSSAIVAVVRSWLEDIEDRQHAERLRFDDGVWKVLTRGEQSELEDRLRNLLLRSARVETERVRRYIERIRSREHLRHHAYGKILPWMPTLATHHARDVIGLSLAELIDDLPATIAARPDDHRLLSRNFSALDWHELAIRDASGEFFPASPLREPFASLFQTSPAGALTFVRDLTNHAIMAWRQLHGLNPTQGTPVPLTLEFPWGQQTFWGDARVYVWPRGHWAPPPVLSSLMALGNWAFEEVQRGRSVDEVIRDVLAGHNSCAVLSIAAALTLESKHVSEVTLPLVTSQRLWHWDITRCVSEGEFGANLIGFMKPSDLPHAEAVRAANNRLSRRIQIRYLTPLFVLSANLHLREAAQAAIQAFRGAPTFDYEEEKSDPERLAHLTRTAEIWSELGKHENYTATPAPDGSGTLIQLESPTASDPDVVEATQRSARMGEQFTLLSWISDSLEARQVSAKLPIENAITHAKALDRQDLYDTPHNTDSTLDFDQSVVAGVAAVIARYAENPSLADIEWSVHILFRAYRTTERRNKVWFSGSALIHHPCLYSTFGLAGLIQRGIQTREAQAALLALAGHPLEKVSEAALDACLSLWDLDAEFAWIALRLAIRLSIGSVDQPISAYGYDHTTQPSRIAMALDTALAELARDNATTALPGLPAPWVFAPPKHRDGWPVRRKGVDDKPIWRDPDEFLRWDFLPKILGKIPVDAVMNDPLRGPAFLSFSHELLNWTLERLNPSWETEKPRRRERNSSEIPELRSALFRMLAQMALHLEPDVVEQQIFWPVFALNDELAASLIHPFVNWISTAGVLDAKEICPRTIVLLQSCLQRLLLDRAWDSARYNEGQLYGFDLPYLLRSFFFVSVEFAGGAARFANGDWREVEAILPIVDPFVRQVGDVADVMSVFLTLCERAVEHYPAATFVDQMLTVLGRHERTPVGWRNTTIPARIAGLVHAFAEGVQPLPMLLTQGMLRILDRLVDMGDRRSAALQTSEIFKNVRVC
jgi:hypothetical protein